MGTREDTFSLPAQPTSPGYARDIVREAIGRSFPPERVDAVVLCVSELVTNALDHADPPYRLRIAHTDDGVRVSVDDSSRRPPEVVSSEPGAERGRGMFLVDSLSTAWGVEDRPGGKSVWAEFDA